VFETILALRASGDLSFFQKVGDVVAVNGEPVCIRHSEVHHLTPSDQSLAFFRELMIGDDSDVMRKVVILRSNSTLFNVTNLGDLANAVCLDCSIREVLAEGVRSLELVQMISQASFVIGGYSTALSQGFWMHGTLIEVIPDGTQCQNWTFEVTKAAGIRHLRFAVGNSTEAAPLQTVGCDANVSRLYNATVEVDIDAVLNGMKS
jgi:hypothetical protein